MNRKALNGDSAAPVLRSSTVRTRPMYAAGPRASDQTTPWYDGSGFVRPGNRSAFATQSNLPASTSTPPMDEPWPPMYFVAECTAMSAPRPNTSEPSGVGTVLSTISGRPWACAASAHAAMSTTFSFGLPIVSANTSRVLSSVSSATDSGRSGSANRTSMPYCGSVCANRL